MHWGTFILTDEPLDEPPKRLESARRDAGLTPEEFFVMKHGETRKLDAVMRPAADSAKAEALAK
jgi:hypothetical protein